MVNSKINVLVYTGEGTSASCRVQTIQSLKTHLGSNYAVQPASASQLVNEPWEETTALIVVPGGADLHYVRDLSPKGTAKIRKFVELGGRYLGLCAGGYFGAREVQFEMGTPLEVHGTRDLAFFPGVARGTVFPGFEYNSMRGCKAAAVDFKDFSAKIYSNGGSQYELDENAQTQGITIIGTYAHNQKPAVVGCTVGSGKAVLCGVHPEFHPSAFSVSDPYEAGMLADLLLGEAQRTAAFRTILGHLDLVLEANPSSDPPPPSNVYFVVRDDAYEKVKSKLSQLSPPYISTVPGKDHTLKFTDDAADATLDRHLTLPIILSKSSPANSGFDSALFYQHLTTKSLGRLLMHGQTVTSTQTILMDHFMALKDFDGLVFTAVTQVSGRGRGNNVWVSPYGCLLTSIQLPPQNFTSILFIEYILAVAIVTVIKSHPGCENFDINIKWPNDVYYQKRVKLGGILVSSNLDLDNPSLFHPIVGLGLNLWNTKPTTCINEIIREHNAKNNTNIPFFFV